MGHTVHLIFIACFVVFCQAKGYFPKLRDFAERSSIKASSTCGETEMKYCDAKTLHRGCTEEVCKYACCPACSNVSPTPKDLAAVSPRRKTEIYNGEARPGTTRNSLGFDAGKGSHIEVNALRTVDHKNKGFSLCVWVNQTLGNEGTVFTKSPTHADSVIYAIVLEDFSVTLLYTPEGSTRTENIKVTPLASQYPADPGAWHFICVMVINTELLYFLDGEYVGTDVRLTNTIADSSGRARVGQMYSGIIKNISFQDTTTFVHLSL